MPWLSSWRSAVIVCINGRDYEGTLKLVGKMRKDPGIEAVKALALVAGNYQMFGYMNIDKAAEEVLNEFIRSEAMPRREVFRLLLEAGHVERYIDDIYDPTCAPVIVDFLLTHGRDKYSHDFPQERIIRWIGKAAAWRLEGVASVIRQYLSDEFLQSNKPDLRQLDARERVRDAARRALALLGESGVADIGTPDVK